MTRLGLGLAALGRPSYINLGRDGVHRSPDELRALAHATLDVAWEAGVRRFDAARSYGRAEEFLGSWFAAHPGHREASTVSSKWGYRYTAGWDRDAEVHEVKEHTLAHFRTQWAETLDALGGPPDLYQVHSLTTGSPLFDDPALLEALAATRAEHGVRLGFSTSGADQADAVRRGLALSVGGERLFTAVQSTWNLLEPSVGGALRAAHDDGALVLVKEGVANGRLVVEPPAALADAARRHGVGPDAVALAGILAQPWADVVLCGAAGPGQLRANLAAADVVLSAEERTALDGLAEAPGDYWAHRADLPWV
ncbi:aldo/keto reductase [Actinomycetospora sp. TBRC 11914]|uniref:aldo/keto reductase n=1 Tax=Actinomycetospora sp. TBRC 11914 TaxID=2729387 RepID=UPI00145F40D0|nr:aldo/keto reductase [Actinomycetospora sp. TBRC 11914]NMO91390.1 aldo/keto reductase [Actinomycetospora sp. TBRC 11914]